MNEHSDMDRVLRTWFESGPSSMPDRVVDIVADRIGRERQRPAWRLRWRPYQMNSTVKIAATLAAVLVLAVVGWNLMPGRSDGVGGQPSPTASPSAETSPSASPSASAEFPSWYTQGGDGAGILPAGSQTTRSFAPGFTFTVPEGWVNGRDESDFFGLFTDTPANEAEFTRSGALANEILMGPQSSPLCAMDATENFLRASADVVASMVANEALATSGVVDVTIGGLTGKQIDVQLDPAWTETCPGATLDIWDMRTRVFLLDDVSRAIVIFVNSLHSADHEAFLAEAMPIVESFEFNLSN